MGIVDDDAATVATWAELARASGYAVRGYRDPRRALHELSRERVDVVLLDLDMPYVSGVTLARALCSAWAGAHPGLVLISGRVARLPASDLAVFDEALCKPVDFEVVLLAVGRAIARGEERVRSTPSSC